MAIEALNEVKKAEAKADEMIKTAQQESKEIILKAKVEAEAAYKNIIDMAKVKAQEIMNSAIELGKYEAQPIIENGRVQCNEIKNTPEAKMKDAAKFVIERIVNVNGNS